ncbi:MAG: hypothetical protein AAGD13_25310 [Pseudomonadota bacterium]
MFYGSNTRDTVSRVNDHDAIAAKGGIANGIAAKSGGYVNALAMARARAAKSRQVRDGLVPVMFRSAASARSRIDLGGASGPEET